jgi:transcriptional regulator with XRE-family HTH domain
VYADRMPSGPPSERKTALGERIALARRRAGLTQKELADILEVATKTVQAWERGKSDPYRRLGDLERLLGVNRDWLLTDSIALAQASDPMTSGRDGFHLPIVPWPGAPIELAGSETESALRKLELRIAMIELRLSDIERGLRSP